MCEQNIKKVDLSDDLEPKTSIDDIKKQEFINNTDKFKNLIQVSLRNKLNKDGFIDIYTYNGMSVRIFADDFELSTDHHISWDIEHDNFIYDKNACVDIIFKNTFKKVVEFTICDERQLHIAHDVLCEIKS